MKINFGTPTENEGEAGWICEVTEGNGNTPKERAA